MVSKLNDGDTTHRVATSGCADSQSMALDISGQSPSSETEKAISARNVLWQPKMSGSVKSRIRNIEAHAQSPEPPQSLHEGVLSKSPLSYSNQELGHYPSVVTKRLSVPSKSESLEELKRPLSNSSSDGPLQGSSLNRGGTWCTAVVSKPYRPGHKSLVSLARSKTLPSVYQQEVTKHETADHANQIDDMPPLPPPWLQDLKRRSGQQRPPWWSRAYSIDEGRLGSLPLALAPKQVRESPPERGSPPFWTTSPLYEHHLQSPSEKTSPPKPPLSPGSLRKTPSSPLSQSPLTKRITTNGPLQDAFSESWPTNGVSKNSSEFSTDRVVVVNQRLNRFEAASDNRKSFSKTTVTKTACGTWNFQLENLRQKYPFVDQDTVFKVGLVKNSRGLGISICGGSDQDQPYSCNGEFIRIKKLFPLQPALEIGKLKVGDIILAVNDRLLMRLKQNEAVDALRICPTNVELLICRPPPGVLPPVPQNDDLAKSYVLSMSSQNLVGIGTSDISQPLSSPKEFEITISKVNGSLGFSLHKKDNRYQGHFIKEIIKEPALSDGRLRPGDQLIKVNSVDVTTMIHEEAIKFLRLSPTEVSLVIERQNDSLQSPLSPSAPVMSEFSQDYLSVKQDKKILRKEAQDLVTEIGRQRSADKSPVYGTSKDRRTRRGKMLEDVASDQSEALSGKSDVDSQRNSPTPTKSNCSSPYMWKSHLTNSTDTTSDLSRESSTSSVPSRNSNSFIEVHRPTLLSPKSGGSANANPQPPKTVISNSLQKPLPSVCVSKWESDGTPSAEETDSDSSGAFIVPQNVYGNVGIPQNPARDYTSVKSPKRPSSLPLHEKGSIDSRYGLMKWKGCALNDVQRSKSFSGEQNLQQLFTVELNRPRNSRLGFSLVHVEIGKLKGSFIKEVHPGTVASQGGMLSSGDRILKINHVSTACKTTDEVIEMLRNLQGKITLEVMRNPVISNAVLTLLNLQSI